MGMEEPGTKGDESETVERTHRGMGEKEGGSE